MTQISEAAASTAGAGEIEAKGQTVPNLVMSICIGWGMGSLGTIVLLQIVNTLLLKYITDILGVTAAIAGIIIAATRLFDAFIDPIMGTISDQTHSKWGRRRPYLLLGAILCACCPLLLFVAPAYLPPSVIVAYIAISLMMYAIAYTVFTVPHLAMTVEMTQKPAERTYLFSFRMYGFAVGNLIGGSFAPWIVGQYNGERAGYEMMALAMTSVTLIACLCCFFMTAKAPVAAVDIAKKVPKLTQFKIAFQNKPLRMLLLIKVFLITGAGVAGGGLAFFVSTVMERSLSIFPIFGIALTAGLLISQSGWLKLATKYGKRKCYLASSIVYTLVALSWLYSGPQESLWIFGLRGFCFGIAAGGALLVSQAMLPDVLQHEIDRTETRNEGVLTGLFSTAERGSSALGVAIAGIILSAGGYITGDPNAVQPESAVNAIRICISVAPAIGLILSMIAAWRYDLPG